MKDAFKQAELQWAIKNKKPLLESVIRASIEKHKQYLKKENRQLEIFET